MKKTVLLFAVALIATACVPKGFGRTVDFEEPSIKDDFCGVYINFQYCKCAFHNEFCDAIGKSKREANSYVQAEFKKWRQTQLDTFAAECASAGGIFDEDRCRYCKEGYVADNDHCVEPEDLADADSEVTAQLPDAIYNADCTVKQDVYDAEWMKYSDIDDAIPFEDRSYEAQQALVAYETMTDKMLEGFALERDVEIEKQMIDELETYRTALVQNLKTNLLKSFWRLAWVTYATIDSTKSLKGSYEKIIEGAGALEQIGAGLKIVRSGVPSSSALAIDTSSVSGKVKSGGLSVALDAVESLGDPVAVATTVFQEAASQSLPSADITDEEVAILKNQQETKGVIDEILAESRAANAVREARMTELETEIADLQRQVDEWEGEEKDRTRNSLEESCKELMKQKSEER
ncbi:MAG: hypothetical protein A3B31_00740 [Candidatus Komeilibacteria bacterium RIFCSPLOWO2_01_FULL_53_11]|uniref:DUF5667 domain-containing protein n=1 Tax=Candidatus Komeilibacteria bacterium RIFCSPLOWO2_01_FULL_53_11 TaxID=1798552 RepID=A0A1G2BTF9_9BACT|nr:MAG: hypothetical protein A3B31_00740 [Candidatus Komeilibacteria bacterium RIFCSPLOWO2_01_FULL_53_11]